MEIKREEVLKLAHLARLEIQDSDVELFQKRLSTVLKYVEELQELPLSPDRFTRHIPADANEFREDRPEPFPSERILANAPKLTDGCFEVPTVVEKSE